MFQRFQLDEHIEVVDMSIHHIVSVDEEECFFRMTYRDNLEQEFDEKCAYPYVDYPIDTEKYGKDFNDLLKKKIEHMNTAKKGKLQLFVKGWPDPRDDAHCFGTDK